MRELTAVHRDAGTRLEVVADGGGMNVTNRVQAAMVARDLRE
ncbi:hypothetical protein [Streptomyces rochei]